VTGLVASTVRPVTVDGLEAVRARAVSGEWQFDIAVVRIGGQAYRLLTAAPRAATSLTSTADSIVSSFQKLTPDEIAALRPLAIHIVTVKPGDTVGTLAARMSGVDRQLELFRILNGLSSTASLSAGEKVKIVSDR
jgi:predicted Zn-dependent protease